MNNFNEQERRTILHLLTMIMEADSLIHPKEIEYINSIMREFNLSQAEFDHMEMLDFSVLKQEFDMMNNDKRNKAMEYFINMAKVDGNLHINELKLINILK